MSEVGTESRIIAVGGSLGALEVLYELLHPLPPSLPAAIVVTVHLPAGTRVSLSERLNQRVRLPVQDAVDGQRLTAGRVFIAVSDHHLTVRDGRMRLERTGHVNRARPSIDVLFRTASRSHPEGVVGVILSGTQDDGAAGLAFIKARGGAALVQDPDDAPASELPRAALMQTPEAQVFPASRLAAGIVRALDTQLQAHPAYDSSVATGQFSEAAVFTCPQCGGAVRERPEVAGELYECHVGHAFSRDGLLGAQSEAIDDALWSAMRALHEQAAMADRGAARAQSQAIAARLNERSEEATKRAAIIRDLLQRDPVCGRRPLVISAALRE
jgi:two-component system chemotaxis response regulator CheB